MEQLRLKTLKFCVVANKYFPVMLKEFWLLKRFAYFNNGFELSDFLIK